MDLWEKDDGDGYEVGEEEVVDFVSNPCQRHEAYYSSYKVKKALGASPVHVTGVCCFSSGQNPDNVPAKGIISLLLLFVPFIAHNVWEEFWAKIIAQSEDASDKGDEGEEAWIPAPDKSEHQGENASSDPSILIGIYD